MEMLYKNNILKDNKKFVFSTLPVRTFLKWMNAIKVQSKIIKPFARKRTPFGC